MSCKIYAAKKKKNQSQFKLKLHLLLYLHPLWVSYDYRLHKFHWYLDSYNFFASSTTMATQHKRNLTEIYIHMFMREILFCSSKQHEKKTLNKTTHELNGNYLDIWRVYASIVNSSNGSVHVRIHETIAINVQKFNALLMCYEKKYRLSYESLSH